MSQYRTFEIWDNEEKKSISVEGIKAGSEWKALCPKHPDKKPSLSVNEEKGVFKCFGCNFHGYLYDPTKSKTNGGNKKLIAVYDYCDVDGNLLYQVCRYDSKDFRVRRPDGRGGWIPNIEGIEPVLYRLSDVQKSQRLLIVEGEKDVDSLHMIGIPATTNPFGAGKWRDGFNRFLEGKDLVAIPDNDEVGKQHMAGVASSFNGTPQNFKLLNLPIGIKDVTDFILSFKNPQDAVKNLEKMIESAEPLKQTGCKELTYSNLHLPSSQEISLLDVKVEWIVDGLIPKDGITLFHAIGGVGKSHLAYILGTDVSKGMPFFGLPVKQTLVYYIDYENPLPEIVDRVKKVGGSEHLMIWHLGHDPMPIRIDAPESGIYKSFPPGLFIVDSLRSSHTLEENSSKDASFVMAKHKELRAAGHTIILIHHEAKKGGYRGSTAWFDLCDHILKFSRVRKIGSDEDVDEDDFDLPIRLGLGGKSRFSSGMELKPMYFKFQDHQLCLADDPVTDSLEKMCELLSCDSPLCRGEFQEMVKDKLGFKRTAFEKLLRQGEKKGLWRSEKLGDKNKMGFFRI